MNGEGSERGSEVDGGANAHFHSLSPPHMYVATLALCFMAKGLARSFRKAGVVVGVGVAMAGGKRDGPGMDGGVDGGG